MFAGGKISSETREEIFKLINIAYVEAIQKDIVRDKKPTDSKEKESKVSSTKSKKKK